MGPGAPPSTLRADEPAGAVRGSRPPQLGGGVDALTPHVAVVPVTGTRGPEQTHVALTSDAGLTRYDVSYADVTALQPAARPDLVALRGRLAAAELDHIGRQVSVYLGL